MPWGQFYQVADATADEALEDENVTARNDGLDGHPTTLPKIVIHLSPLRFEVEVCNLIPFLYTYIYRCTHLGGSYLDTVEWPVGGEALFNEEPKQRFQPGSHLDDGILTSWFNIVVAFLHRCRITCYQLGKKFGVLLRQLFFVAHIVCQIFEIFAGNRVYLKRIILPALLRGSDEAFISSDDAGKHSEILQVRCCQLTATDIGLD